MRGAHVIKLLFEFAVFEFILLFFEGFLIGDNAVLGGELGRERLTVELGTSLSGGLALDFERIK
jgi:hypothetical protein